MLRIFFFYDDDFFCLIFSNILFKKAGNVLNMFWSHDPEPFVTVH